MKRAGRLNCALSFLVAILVAWYAVTGGGSRATISAFTALAAALCGFIGGWVGWRTRKAHKRHTPLRQVGTIVDTIVATGAAADQATQPLGLPRGTAGLRSTTKK